MCDIWVIMTVHSLERMFVSTSGPTSLAALSTVWGAFQKAQIDHRSKASNIGVMLAAPWIQPIQGNICNLLPHGGNPSILQRVNCDLFWLSLMLADLKFSLDCSQMRFLLCARKLQSSLLCEIVYFYRSIQMHYAFDISPQFLITPLYRKKDLTIPTWWIMW